VREIDFKIIACFEGEAYRGRGKSDEWLQPLRQPLRERVAVIHLNWDR